MDSICIKDLEIYGYHGYHPEENYLGQMFSVSVTCWLDFQKAGQSDDLADTVSYAKIAHFVEKVFLRQTYKLIERCAETLAQEILLQFPIQKVSVTVKKPWAPMKSHLRYASVQVERMWHIAYIGLGSNLGDRESNLAHAIKALEKEGILVLNTSPIYETKPWGVLDQPDFLNAVVKVRTLYTPETLLAHCLSIEEELQRIRQEHWGPRTIDLDILLYDHITTENSDVVIPHPELANRYFVLKPLSDIAPLYVHPLLQERILTLAQKRSAMDGDTVQAWKYAT